MGRFAALANIDYRAFAILGREHGARKEQLHIDADSLLSLVEFISSIRLKI